MMDKLTLSTSRKTLPKWLKMMPCGSESEEGDLIDFVNTSSNIEAQFGEVIFLQNPIEFSMPSWPKTHVAKLCPIDSQ